MKKKTYILVGVTAGIILLISGLWYFEISEGGSTVKKSVAEEVEQNPIKMKKARGEYFHKLLRDPATDEIPKNIRSRELKHAKKIPSKSGRGLRQKTVQGNPNIDLNWDLVGPKDLGGRTRALAIDERDSDIIIAGGVSGGIWKSTDGGNTWNLKSDPNQNLSVTWVTQDPNNKDTWYYSSGEYAGNSAADRGKAASYYGTGIYKSTDNGDSWSVLPATEDKNNSFDSNFDFTNKVEVSPTTGSIFVASNPTGLLRSIDGGSSFSIVQGAINHHTWTGFDINQNGNILAVFSSRYAGDTDPGNDPGVFYSTDDGNSWDNITPSNFPTNHGRSVVDIAPSNPDVAYVFTQKLGSGSNQGVAFYKIDVSDPQNPSFEDRSANLPDFGGSVGGVNLQGGYNMVVTVKPDDSDFVMIGGTNLFRSRDGFATSSSTNKDEHWIGGYAKINNVSQYSAHHPDQHVIAYDPNDPNKVWSGHDGGVSSTSDIRASSINWQDKDEGYVTGQFYTVAIPSQAGDNRYMGGTQDNGTPYFRAATGSQPQTNLIDISSGDGSYAFWGSQYAYVSSQGGKVTRLTIENNGDLTSPYNTSTSTDYASVYPSGASGQLFVHPFAIDPNDDSIMYYPGGAKMWINTETDQIANYNSEGSTQGWNEYTGTSSSGYQVSTLEVTSSQPSDRLYYATSSSSGKPEIFYSDDAFSNFNPQDISIPGAPSGAYVHDIAANPINGDEAIVVMSNYGIVGLYHTDDGGTNWTPIEGDLQGNGSSPGPSLRSATILPTQAGPVFFVGTSTGIYSTGVLSGSSTSWVRESDDGSPGSIGYSVVEYITSRVSDGTIAAATHGRGIFEGEADVNLVSDGMTPTAPTGLMMGGQQGTAELSWDANTETDITNYYVYRGTDSGHLAVYDSVAALGNPSYTDDNLSNSIYYYNVSAKDVDNNESSASTLLAYNKEKQAINNSWELRGASVSSSSGASTNSSSTIYGFSGSYQTISTLEPNKGFWIKSRSGSVLSFDGEANTSASISLDQGWNLIGGIADTITTSAVNDPGSILSSTDIFRYQGGAYQTALQINPNEGYWVNADQSGAITLSVGGGSPKNNVAAADKDGLDVVSFQRANSTQKFYVSGTVLDDPKRQAYRMPPKAPKPQLDVRTANGYRLADKANTQLELTTQSFPVKVQLSPQSLSEGYNMKGVTDQDTVYYDLKPGKTVSIQRKHEKILLDNSAGGSGITETSLQQNYPNPFNGVTKVRYQLASKTDVNIQVYDVLGRKVRTLIDTEQQSGKYNLQFDGSDLASGTYLIHLEADNTVQVKKMTLIK